MNHVITIYSTSSCHYCQLAKDFLRSKNIAFTEYNVGLDPEKRAEMVELTGQMGVPVIVVDGAVMVGYEEAKLSEMVLGESTPSTTGSDEGLWDKVKHALGVK